MNRLKILVTGSSGFIGSHLVSYLQEKELDVQTADIRSGDDLTQRMVTEKLGEFDVVFHLAAYNGTRWFYERPFSVIQNTLQPTLNLVERYSNTDTLFVYASSCEMYADGCEAGINPVPTPEEISVLFRDPENPRWSYAASKLLGEMAVMGASREQGLKYVILRYHNVYGPGQMDHFVPEFIERAQRGDFSLRGWKNTRSFCYVDDAVEMTVKAASHSEAVNKVLNVGVDEEISIKEVAEIMLDILQIKTDLDLDEAPEGSVTRRCPDVSRIKTLGIYQNSETLRSGLEKTIRTLT